MKTLFVWCIDALLGLRCRWSGHCWCFPKFNERVCLRCNRREKRPDAIEATINELP